MSLLQDIYLTRYQKNRTISDREINVADINSSFCGVGASFGFLIRHYSRNTVYSVSF